MKPKRQKLDKDGRAKRNGAAEDDTPHIRFASSANWDKEQDWEGQVRLGKRKVKENTRLPTKSADGRIMFVAPTEEEEEESESVSSDEEEEEVREETPEVEEKPEKPAPVRIREAKEEMAKIAMLLNEDPEEHVGLLKRLKELANDSNSTVRQLAIAAQSAIYRDIIPGYRIRPLSEDEQKVKVTKDVKKLRQFEQSLLKGYRGYIGQLDSIMRDARRDHTKATKKLAKIAIHCTTFLLEHCSHFNFFSELLKIVVDRISNRHIDEEFKKCRECLENIFRDDIDGDVSLEAVKLLTKMFKAKDYRIHESVLNTLLSLRLLSELKAKGSTDRVDKEHLKKKERVFRTKKERVAERERQKIEKEMKVADAAASSEQRDRNQGETLKLVFITYFRILKEKPPGLMGATLEGLARFAHLINVDFFSDILEALKDLIRAAEANTAAEIDPDDEEEEYNRNATRESLLCVVTAFALLHGQTNDSGLTLDLSFFTQHLYATLFPLSMNPDVEISAKSLRLADPLDLQAKRGTKVNVHSEIEMAVRALEEVLFRARTGSVVHTRLAAFAKRLMVAAVQFPERSALASIGLVSKIARRNQTKLEGLFISEESVGEGAYKIECDEPELSNPLAATVWETILLEKHYSPKVAEAARTLPKLFNVKKQ